MTRSTELESFLSSFQGEVESEGTFSVALDKAMHKLQQFQLERPSFFVVELLAVAVLGGATFFEARTEGQRLEFEFDGKSFSSAVLERLDDHAFLGSPDRHLRRLAIALRAVQTMKPASVVFTSQGPEQTATWRYKGQSAVKAVARASGESHNRLEVTLRTGIRALFGGPVPSLRTLLKPCGLAPLSLTVDGSVVEVPRPTSELSVALVRPGVALPDSWLESADTRIELGESPDFSAYVHVGDTQPRRLAFLVDGIALEANHALLGSKYIQALVVFPRARLDLSHASVLEDSAFLEVVSRLQWWARKCIAEHTLSVPRPELPHYWNQLARESRAYLQEVGDTELASRLANWIEAGRLESLDGLQGAVARTRAVLPKASLIQAGPAFEARPLSERIAHPDWAAPEFARELEDQGRHGDAQRVRHNFALLAANMILETQVWNKAREICQKALPEMGQPRLEPLRALFQQLLAFRPEPPEYMLALDRGDIATAIALLRPGDQPLVLAECLDLRDDRESRREALRVRLASPPRTSDSAVSYCHYELTKRNARGVVSLVDWVRLQVLSSWSARCVSTSLTWMLLPGSVREVLLGRPPCEKTMREFEQAIEEYEIPRDVAGYFYTRILFEFRRWGQSHKATELYLEILARQVLTTLQRQIQRVREGMSSL